MRWLSDKDDGENDGVDAGPFDCENVELAPLDIRTFSLEY